MRRYQVGIGVLSAAATFGLGAPSMAGVVPLTWDPSQAAPGLVAGPAAFTADNIEVLNYLRATHVNDLSSLRQTFTIDQIQPITGFSLGGSPVAAPGLNSAYGLYFQLAPVGFYPINSSGTPIGPPTYTQLNMALVADVNHDNGNVLVNASGIGFSNPAGAANDVILATGSLITASVMLGADGVRRAHYLTTFLPDPGQAAFFVAPGFTVSWEEFLQTPAASFSSVPIDALTTINIVNGDLGSHGSAQLIPEPAALGTFAAGLLGLALLRRRCS